MFKKHEYPEKEKTMWHFCVQRSHKEREPSLAVCLALHRPCDVCLWPIISSQLPCLSVRSVAPSHHSPSVFEHVERHRDSSRFRTSLAWHRFFSSKGEVMVVVVSSGRLGHSGELSSKKKKKAHWITTVR